MKGCLFMKKIVFTTAFLCIAPMLWAECPTNTIVFDYKSQIYTIQLKENDSGFCTITKESLEKLIDAGMHSEELEQKLRQYKELSKDTYEKALKQFRALKSIKHIFSNPTQKINDENE
jgi:hypothetical protein